MLWDPFRQVNTGLKLLLLFKILTIFKYYLESLSTNTDRIISRAEENKPRLILQCDKDLCTRVGVGGKLKREIKRNKNVFCKQASQNKSTTPLFVTQLRTKSSPKDINITSGFSAQPFKILYETQYTLDNRNYS